MKKDFFFSLQSLSSRQKNIFSSNRIAKQGAAMSPSDVNIFSIPQASKVCLGNGQFFDDQYSNEGDIFSEVVPLYCRNASE